MAYYFQKRFNVLLLQINYDTDEPPWVTPSPKRPPPVGDHFSKGQNSPRNHYLYIFKGCCIVHGIISVEL